MPLSEAAASANGALALFDRLVTQLRENDNEPLRQCAQDVQRCFEERIALLETLERSETYGSAENIAALAALNERYVGALRTYIRTIRGCEGAADFAFELDQFERRLSDIAGK